MAGKKKYPEELLERGARMVFDSGRPIAHVARDLGIHHESLRKWVRQTEADEGKRSELLSSEERRRLKELERENRELRRANDILKSASAFSPPSSTHAERSERLYRAAPGPLRGRADLQDRGGVGLRLLRARQGREIGARDQDERLLERRRSCR
jgi:transposase